MVSSLFIYHIIFLMNCIYMYVCVCVYIYIYMYVYIYICKDGILKGKSKSTETQRL